MIHRTMGGITFESATSTQILYAQLKRNYSVEAPRDSL